ncbi:MAG: MFS transporter [Burkholderiales bacterium]|nr:MFS transporter [Burkholderiales bacterium]
MRFPRNSSGWIFPLTILTLSAFLMEMTFTMITPFLQLYLVKELNVPTSEVNTWSGWIFSITFFIGGLMGPIWGLLSDRKSRKLMALRASIGLAIAYSLCGVVQTPLQLFFARFFQGFCAGLYPALLALIATNMPHNRMGFSMGLLQGGMTVGGIAGPFLGGVLAEIFGMRLSFFIGGCSLLAVAMLIMIFVKEGNHPVIKKKTNLLNTGVLKNRRVLIMLFTSMLVYTSLYMLPPILPLYLAALQKSMDNIMMVAGSVFSICGISVMIASPILGMVGQKYGFLKVLIFALFASAILIVAQILATSVAGFTAWRFFGGFAVAGLIPTINSLLTVYTPSEESGTVFGYNFLFSHVGMTIGPAGAGMLANHVSYGSIIALSGLILIPVAFFLISIRKSLLVPASK